MKSPREGSSACEAGILAQLLDSNDRRLGGGGLLLSQAVQRAEAEDEVAARNADDFASWEKASKGIKRGTIGGIVKGRNDHDFVGDVEVRVAGGEALAGEI